MLDKSCCNRNFDKCTCL